MGIRETLQMFNSSDPKPDFLEIAIVACTLLMYVIYLVYILITGNSRVFSFTTLIITLGTVIILAIREVMGNKRGWIIAQYAILFGLVCYICLHRWNGHVMRSMSVLS
jgi:hypothetical protein